MIFFYAKGTGNCKTCGSGTINRNDFCVKEFMKNKDTGQGFSVTFHYDCYLNYTLENIRRWATNWQSAQNKRVKIGRPQIYTNGKRANQLKSLIKYYKNKGKPWRITELELELSKLICY